MIAWSEILQLWIKFCVCVCMYMCVCMCGCVSLLCVCVCVCLHYGIIIFNLKSTTFIIMQFASDTLVDLHAVAQCGENVSARDRHGTAAVPVFQIQSVKLRTPLALLFEKLLKPL